MQPKEKKVWKPKKLSHSSHHQQQMRATLLLLKAVDYFEFSDKKQKFLNKLLSLDSKRQKRDPEMTFLQEEAKRE